MVDFPQRKGPSGPENILSDGRDRYQWSGGGPNSLGGFEGDLTDALIPAARALGGDLGQDGPDNQFLGAQRINYDGTLILGNMQLVDFEPSGEEAENADFDGLILRLRVGPLSPGLYPPDQMLEEKAQLVVPDGTILLLDAADFFESTEWTEPGGGASLLNIPVKEGEWALISYDTGDINDAAEVAIWVAWVLEG